jgi:hypothetical protein
MDALMVLRADFGDKRSERRQGATMEKTISLDECPICHLAYDTFKAKKHKEVARCQSERMDYGTGVPFNQNEGGLWEQDLNVLSCLLTLNSFKVSSGQRLYLQLNPYSPL